MNKPQVKELLANVPVDNVEELAADATAATIVTTVNSLLTALKDAGLMAADTE